MERKYNIRSGARITNYQIVTSKDNQGLKAKFLDKIRINKKNVRVI